MRTSTRLGLNLPEKLGKQSSFFPEFRNYLNVRSSIKQMLFLSASLKVTY
jgi:hypothetical protein